MKIMSAGVAAMCWVLLASSQPIAAQNVEITVQNLSNSPIYVGTAYGQWVGNYGGAGWAEIGRNQSKKFAAPLKAELHLRVQDANGQEITWNDYQNFRNFAAGTGHTKWAVQRSPNNPNVFPLSWGDGQGFNLKSGGALPEGWERVRFFKVGDQNRNLQVTP